MVGGCWWKILNTIHHYEREKNTHKFGEFNLILIPEWMVESTDNEWNPNFGPAFCGSGS